MILPNIVGAQGVKPDSGNTIVTKYWGYKPYILIGGQNSSAGTITYSQALTEIIVTHTSHGMTADFDGGEIYLPQGTGALISGWFTDWTYINANSYSCTSTVSQTTSGNLGTNTAETFTPVSYTVPSELISAGVSLSLVWIRKVITTGTKTIRTYFNSILNEATNITTTTQWGNTNSATNAFVTDTKYYANGVSTDLQTLVSPTYTGSLQCSIATTWIAAYPTYVSYVDRSISYA